ncbi:hypothetical protein [Agrobacterium tumefaciens]|nr:hypothetical protein [Agrobacterium tumefaciens]
MSQPQKPVTLFVLAEAPDFSESPAIFVSDASVAIRRGFGYDGDGI